jgi:hypothetical protein
MTVKPLRQLSPRSLGLRGSWLKVYALFIHTLKGQPLLIEIPDASEGARQTDTETNNTAPPSSVLSPVQEDNSEEEYLFIGS